MKPVHFIEVNEDEAGARLDRWFRRHFPVVNHGRLEKLLRTGQVRVNGRRAKAGQRLAVCDNIRIPPFSEAAAADPAPRRSLPSSRDAELIREAVLYRDDALIVLNKPPGLAMQGGSKTVRHLDGLLGALRFDAAEPPRLVHRLDKDTSGCVVLARTLPAARRYTRLFQTRRVIKTYWALVVGVPPLERGQIDLAIAKKPGPKGEKVRPERGGQTALTRYVCVDHAARIASWLVLRPETGRTHQLRVHCAAMDTPVLGDGKYGGEQAFLEGCAKRLHLHARAVRLVNAKGKMIEVEAPLPAHMIESGTRFGFDWKHDRDLFEDAAG